MEALHDLYEVETAKLGETEMTLLADRLTQLRKAALRDIPNRFDVAVQGYKEECDKWVGRLEKCKSFARLTVIRLIVSAISQTGTRPTGTSGLQKRTSSLMAS